MSHVIHRARLYCQNTQEFVNNAVSVLKGERLPGEPPVEDWWIRTLALKVQAGDSRSLFNELSKITWRLAEYKILIPATIAASYRDNKNGPFVRTAVFRWIFDTLVGNPIVRSYDTPDRARERRAEAIAVNEGALAGRFGPLFGPMVELTNRLGPIGSLNYQGVLAAGSINASVEELLKNKETEDIGNAIRELTKAITLEPSLNDETRTELLEQVLLLGSQAATPAEQRKLRIIRPIIDAIAGVSAGVGGLAAAWGTWGAVITKFFGL
jgi:hypothetical protein